MSQEKVIASVSMLKNDKPTTILRRCLHSWQLKRQGDTFFLACPWCHTTTKGKELPAAFQHLLDAAALLDPIYQATEQPGKKWRVTETDVLRAVSLLNLPNQSRSQRCKIWDIYATLHIMLNLKTGQARGNLAVKNKTLTKLIEVAMYPNGLKTMPLSSRKRYKFVADAIRMLPSRLSQISSATATRPLWAERMENRN